MGREAKTLMWYVGDEGQRERNKIKLKNKSYPWVYVLIQPSFQKKEKGGWGIFSKSLGGLLRIRIRESQVCSLTIGGNNMTLPHMAIITTRNVRTLTHRHPTLHCGPHKSAACQHHPLLTTNM